MTRAQKQCVMSLEGQYSTVNRFLYTLPGTSTFPHCAAHCLPHPILHPQTLHFFSQ